MIKNLFKFAIVCMACHIAIACSEQEYHEWIEPNEEENNSSNNPKPDPEKPSAYAGRIEIPELKGGENHPFITHTTSSNGKEIITYSYEYDCTLHHSNWVAFTFSTSTPDNQVGRTVKRPYPADPSLPAEHQLKDESYTNSGYSRGHLVASDDRQYTAEANEQTFYMSNMSPQIQNGFNGGIWEHLEKKVQAWGHGIKNNNDTLYVVKGGTIKEGQILKTFEKIKGHKVAVPKYYFMALLWLKDGQYKAIGFWLEHKSYPKTESYAKYALSIEELEEKTGFNFFHNLNDADEKKAESKAHFNKKDWGL